MKPVRKRPQRPETVLWSDAVVGSISMREFEDRHEGAFVEEAQFRRPLGNIHHVNGIAVAVDNRPAYWSENPPADELPSNQPEDRIEDVAGWTAQSWPRHQQNST